MACWQVWGHRRPLRGRAGSSLPPGRFASSAEKGTRMTSRASDGRDVRVWLILATIVAAALAAFSPSRALAVADLPPPKLTPPASSVAGESCSVTFTITNQGDVSANPTWRDFIWLSTNNTLDGGDVLLATPTRGSVLAAGGSYTTTVTPSIPNNT